MNTVQKSHKKIRIVFVAKAAKSVETADGA